MWEEGGSGGFWLHLAPIASHRDGIPSTRTRAESDRGSPDSHASASSVLSGPLCCWTAPSVHPKKLQLSLWTQGRVLHTYLTLFLTHAQHFWNMMHFSSFYLLFLRFCHHFLLGYERLKTKSISQKKANENVLGRVCCSLGCSWCLGSGGAGLALAAESCLLHSCRTALMHSLSWAHVQLSFMVAMQ